MSSPKREQDLQPFAPESSSDFSADSGGNEGFQRQEKAIIQPVSPASFNSMLEDRTREELPSTVGSQTAARTSGNLLEDSMYSLDAEPDFWPSDQVPSSVFEIRGSSSAPNEESASTQPVSPYSLSSMSSPERARERILAKVGSGTAARSTSRILSKVSTGGRIRLERGEASVRFLEESISLNVGKGHISPRWSSNSKQVEGKSMDIFGEISEDDPPGPLSLPVSPPRRVVAMENRRPARTYTEDPVNFHTWDGLKNMTRTAWSSFVSWINRRTLKDIKASIHVLGTYHDAFLYGKVPLTVQTRIRIRTGWIGFLWHILEFLFGVLSASLYIYSTYQADVKDHWVSGLQQAISCAFLADYVLRLYSEPSRFYYVFSFWGAMDFLSLLPVILIFRDDMTGVNFIRLLQFVRILRIFSLINKSHVGRSVNQQIILMSVATFGIIILDAGLIQWIEYYTASESYRETCPQASCFTFWQSFYFLIATVGTVGYGDFAAKTGLGRFVVCITIIGALTLIPIRVGQITSLAYLSPFGGSGRVRSQASRFLILSGGISLLAVQNFLAEFYKHTHRQEFEVFPLRVVIMGSHHPSFDLKQVLSHYGKAEFIEGSVLRPEDLERVSAHKAMAILLVAYQESNNTQLEDSAQIMRALAVHRFCRIHGEITHPIRIIVEVLDPATQRSAVWDEKYTGSIEVICPTKIHYILMARSCFVKGLYTLIANLFTSELRLKHMDERDFLSEYYNSFDNEIYPVILPPPFHGLPFEEVAEMILELFNSTLFALDTPIPSKVHTKKHREVLLFPKGHIVRLDDVGLVITNDLETAFKISKFQSKEQEVPSPVGVAQRFRALVRSTFQSREQNLDEVGLLMRVRRSFLDNPGTFFRHFPSYIGDGGFGVRSEHVFPEGPDSEFGLESQFRTAIQEVYTQQEYPDWRSNPVSSVGDAQHTVPPEGVPKEATPCGHEELVGGSEFRFSKGMSLEKAAEELLTWPPVRKTAPPHPSVLEQREEEILGNLRDRTLTMVALQIPHILVCCQLGWPTNFFYFLAELRNPKFASPPVVILYPEDPSYMQWGSVGMFADVFFLKGSPKYELDLMRGGVLQAARIVIFSSQGQPVDLGGAGVMDDRFVNRTAAAYTSDIENIVVAANVQRLYGNKAVEKVIVEMQHPNAFHYLRPHYKVPFSQFRRTDYTRNREALIHFGPPFMEGKATSKAMLGFLMRASFFNRNTVSIVEQLIKGGFASTRNGLSSDRQRILDHTEVPPACANKTFQKLYTYLLHEKNMLAIGLYRVRGNLGAPTSYVLTNPRKGCIVNPDDLVYVIT
ncbi:protein MpBK2B [Marchantia polymorpha subsp. ruderalis]